MREIVFDTETTGLSFAAGDRIVEIGCVEMINRVETGRTYHAYFNPERDMPVAAQQIHNLSAAFLAKHPVFASTAPALIDFIGDAPLVAHSAGFDMAFLNGELGRCGHPLICQTRVIDTVAIARQRHPGAKHSLDALCSRYGVDRSHRVFHGALLDAQLLAQVYVELTGGRQIGLGLVGETAARPVAPQVVATSRVRPPRIFRASDREEAAHAAFMAAFKDPLWGIDPAIDAYPGYGQGHMPQ